MAATPSDSEHVKNGPPETLSEREMNYPHFRNFVHDKLREEFEQTLEELPSSDLESLACEWDAKPLEEFIGEFESPSQGSKA